MFALDFQDFSLDFAVFYSDFAKLLFFLYGFHQFFVKSSQILIRISWIFV
jgi:hypothetical protein